MKASRFLVSGAVQGVGYRIFTVRAAQSLGLKGFARNLPDGRVEVVAAGDAESLGRLRERLQAGPRGSVVSGLEETETEIDPAPEEFEVRF